MRSVSCYFLCCCIGLFLISLKFSTCQKIAFPVVCSSSQFFDTTSLQCSSCGQGSQTSNATTFCQCNSGYINILSTSGSYICTDCSSFGMQTSSQDRSVCMNCSNFTLGYNPVTRDCYCPPNMILVEKDVAGNYLSNGKICLTCPNTSYVDPTNPYNCISCPSIHMIYSQGRCSCTGSYTTWENQCIYTPAYSQINNQYPADTASTVTFKQINDGSSTSSTAQIRSQLFFSYFYPAAANCMQFKDQQSCNMLANLCVLTLYDPTSSACRVFNSIYNAETINDVNGFNGWKSTLPFLTYTDPSSSVLINNDLTFKVSFSPQPDSVNRLTFYLSKYTVNGTWLGFSQLETDLELCPGSPLELSRFLNFGTQVQVTCNFNVFWLLTQPQPLFYDLYIYDSFTSTLYPVPVQLRTDDSITISSASSGSLYRRFFMYDNLAGLQIGGSSVPDVVRFAQSVELRMTLNPSGSSQMYPPLLSIKYSGRLTTSQQQSSNPHQDPANLFPTSFSSSLNTPPISFTASYYMDMSTTWIVMLVFICITLALAILIAFVRVYIYQKRCQNMTIDLKVIFRMFISICAAWSDLSFVIIYGVAAYCYLFFKYPTNAYTLLPNSNLDLTYFYVLLGFTLLAKFFDVAFSIYHHCSYDIFFIDFEKSRGKILGNRGRTDGKSKVSIWRTIMVAKTWKQIQSYYVIRMAPTLFFLLFLLDGVNLIYLSSEQPNPSYLSSQDRTNPVLRFAIVSTLWISIALAQYLYYRLFHFRFIRNPLWLFIDLCSLCNISLFILSEQNYGYYIHGESPHPHSDADMKEFNTNLIMERDNKVRDRGLVHDQNLEAGEPCQTFEIYILPQTRQTYIEKLSIPIAEERLLTNNRSFPQQGVTSPGIPSQISVNQPISSTKNQQEPSSVLNHLSMLRFHDLLTGSLTRKKAHAHSEKLCDAYNNLNAWLQHYIRELKRNQICEKQTTHRLGFPPETLLFDTFFNDTSFSFKTIMMMGIELKMMVFYILLFGILDVGINNNFISLMVVYVIHKIILEIRNLLVNRNITNKTLLDDRFLF